MDVEEIQSSTALGAESDIPKVIGIHSICRLCATQSDKLISFYGEEGISNGLSNKVNLYLPVKVSAVDSLPQQCCWNCASTVLAWHELVIASVETDRRLRNCQFVTKKNVEFENTENTLPEENERIGPEPMSTGLNSFCQTQITHDEQTFSGESRKIAIPAKRKKRQEMVSYYSSPEPSNTLETYISSIEQHFIVESNLPEADNVEIDEYKLNIEDEDVLKMEDDKNEIDKDFTETQKDFVCPSSDDDNPNFSSLPIKPEENSVYACHYCSVVFVLKTDVLNHIKKDHPGSETIEPIPQRMPQQKIKRERRKNNKINQDMTNAAKVVVDGRIYYNCKECGKSLHSPYTYVWHMRIHTGERPYVCDLCGKQFRVSQGLVRHLRETHEGIKKFPCDLCGRMFATRRNVEEHRRIHTNERPYICDLCGKSFKQKASLFVHKRSHKNYFPFKCPYCNQGFRTKPPLMVHITRHTGEKPYKCETCGRCFRIKYELKRHRLIHSDEKPFVCNLCGLSFRQKRYLRNHIKSNHTLAAS